MAKFNFNVTSRTINHEGHAAYRMDDKTKLVTQVLTSFFNEDKFYGDNTAELKATLKRVIDQDAEFVSKLAVFARREFNMRSVAHVLTAYLAHESKGKEYVRKTVRGVTLRGDDVTEIMSFYLSEFGKPVPNSLKKGINDVLVTFDEYTLAKYKGDGKNVSMRDVLRITRPTPKDVEQSALFKRCIDGELATPVTWETELSAHGNNRETWTRLISSNKVGYMALLRNLRNILQASPDNIEKVYARLEDPEAVRRSRQLPFRYLSAYKSLSGIGGSRVYDVLENAADASVANIPKLKGTTVIAIDTSGSMSYSISSNTSVRCSEIAALLGILANRICENAIVYTFNTQITPLAVSHRSGILHSAMTYASASGGTYMELPFKKMLSDRIKADRVIIVSDNECNSPYRGTVQHYADEYRNKSGRNIWVHAIDIMGYGTQQFAGSKTNIIAGWSEKVFEFISMAEEGTGSLVRKISEYSW